MRASIIIAAHQEGALLGKTIESCLRNCSDLEREIIVADDASSDGSVDDLQARYPEVIVVRHEPRRGVSATKDLGARRAVGEVLVFLDAHTHPEPGAVLRLVEDVERLEGGAAVTPAIPTLCTKTWRNRTSSTGHGFSLDLETLGCNWLPLDRMRKVSRAGRDFYESPALIGCAFAVARELYDALWGFDRDMLLWGVEDLDFSLKCWLSGHPILHDPLAVVGHRFQESFSTYQVSAVHLLANQLRTAYKHLSLSTWPEWLRHCRERHCDWSAERPEGVFGAGWHEFRSAFATAERERIYLLASRIQDDFRYAERFALPWPVLGQSSRGSLPVVLQPFADPSPSPSPSPSPCKGTLFIFVEGTTPPDTGPRFVCVDFGITLVASITGGAFPDGRPVWTWLQKPAGSAVQTPAAGTNPVTVEPDVEGTYVLQAACDDITATFRFIGGTVTLSEYGFAGDKITLITDNGTYADESGDPVRVPEYIAGQPNSPVCYPRDSTVTVEATFTISPDLGGEQLKFNVDGLGMLTRAGTTFNFGATITLTGSSVQHEFTLTPILPDFVINDTLELTWGTCGAVRRAACDLHNLWNADRQRRNADADKSSD